MQAALVLPVLVTAGTSGTLTSAKKFGTWFYQTIQIIQGVHV